MARLWQVCESVGGLGAAGRLGGRRDVTLPVKIMKLKRAERRRQRCNVPLTPLVVPVSGARLGEIVDLGRVPLTLHIEFAREI